MPTHRLGNCTLFGEGAKTMNQLNSYHDAYRSFRAKGHTRTEALKLSQRQYPELYKAFFKAQENGEDWTREPLDEKHYTALQRKGQLT